MISYLGFASRLFYSNFVCIPIQLSPDAIRKVNKSRALLEDILVQYKGTVYFRLQTNIQRFFFLFFSLKF